MKKEKLKLEGVKVQSFVTSIKHSEKQTIDGGAIYMESGYGMCLANATRLCYPAPQNTCGGGGSNVCIIYPNY